MYLPQFLRFVGQGKTFPVKKKSSCSRTSILVLVGYFVRCLFCFCGKSTDNGRCVDTNRRQGLSKKDREKYFEYSVLEWGVEGR